MPVYSDLDAPMFAERKFDYVIVGAGTAGLALASRLSEDPLVSVAVIEAGENVADLPIITTPGMFGMLMMHEKHDWNMVTVPQKYAGDKVVIQSRGKIIGGSSAVSTTICVDIRSKDSTEQFLTHRKASSSSETPDGIGKSFLKYFKKSETLMPPTDEYRNLHSIALDPQWHGTDGPIKKSFGSWIPSGRGPLVKAMEALDLPVNPDPASGDNFGVNLGLSSVDPKTSTRSYSYTAYLLPNRERANLNVLTGAEASEIILEDGPGGITARGVKVVAGNRRFVIKAQLEVILCAGALKSPQLLELSGIGQRSILEKYGINVILDLPVGENLRESRNLSPFLVLTGLAEDHYNVPVVFEMHSDYDTAAMDETDLAIQTQMYRTQKVGKLSSGPQEVSWIPFSTLADEAHQDRLRQLFSIEKEGFERDNKKGIFDLYSQWLDKGRHAQMEQIYFPAIFPGAGTPEPGKKYQTLLWTQTHPLSRGSVHIQSGDYKVSPAIDPAHYKAPFDLELTINAVKFARKLAKTEPFASTIVKEILPGEGAATDEQLADHCKKSINSMYHAVGSVSMLPQEAGGVVDSNLVVYGATNLRVVDASIIPFHLTCHMQSTVYAIAEKAADIIKAARK